MSKTEKMPSIPDLYKYADVSIAHISKLDMETLSENSFPNNERFPLTVAEYEHGFFIPLPDRGSLLKDPDHGREKELKRFGMSDAFCKLIVHCVECKAVVLRLDRDADEIEGLKKFNW